MALMAFKACKGRAVLPKACINNACFGKHSPAFAGKACINNACFGKHSPAFAGFESLKTIQARVQNLLSTLVLANKGLYL